MACYLTSKHYDRRNKEMYDDLIKNKENRKKEKDRHKPTKAEIARLLQQDNMSEY